MEKCGEAHHRQDREEAALSQQRCNHCARQPSDGMSLQRLGREHISPLLFVHCRFPIVSRRDILTVQQVVGSAYYLLHLHRSVVHDSRAGATTSARFLYSYFPRRATPRSDSLCQHFHPGPLFIRASCERRAVNIRERYVAWHGISAGVSCLNRCALRTLDHRWLVLVIRAGQAGKRSAACVGRNRHGQRQSV
jgi:hypothetical protein